MRRKRRVVSKDGLIVTELEDLTSLSDAELRALGPPPGGLESYLHDAEQIWRPYAAPPGTALEKESLEWYADGILASIRYLRAARERGQLEQVGLAALQLGRLHTEAFWWHNLGDNMQLGAKVRRKNRDAGRKPRTHDRQHVEDSDARIEQEAQRLRQRHPSYSQRSLARAITQLQVVPYSFSTIRRRLKALGFS